MIIQEWGGVLELDWDPQDQEVNDLQICREDHS